MPHDSRIDDIALFFSENAKCWISHEIYADTAPEVTNAPPHWMQNVLFSLEGLDSNQPPFYVVNLSQLFPPGYGDDEHTEEIERVLTLRRQAFAARMLANVVERPQPVAVSQLAPGDLVVIPWDDASKAYVVPKSVYEDKEKCPKISDASGADLEFLAQTEGALLANVPKEDLAGMSCYLLNLRALKAR